MWCIRGVLMKAATRMNSSSAARSSTTLCLQDADETEHQPSRGKHGVSSVA